MHSTIDGPLDYLHFEASVNNIAMNIFVSVSQYTYAFLIPRNYLLLNYKVCIF